MAFDFKLHCPFCFFLFFLLLPFSSTAQSYSNITLGSSLVAQDDKNSMRASPSGDFAFGFRRIGKDGFLLAIWFDKIPEKTIVWSANRDVLVQRGSKVELTTDGRLVLVDQRGQEIWSAIASNTGISYAAMLDTGNLVLASQDNNSILWQSFDHPTDTLLPTQTMIQGDQLIASYTETNYSSGRFKFILQIDGNLLLYTTNFPLNDAVAPYWSTQDTIGSGFQVFFQQSGYIYLAARNGSALHTVFPELSPTQTRDSYLRVIVDYDGVLRQYAHPRTTRSDGSWTTLSFEPSNICRKIGGGNGNGACGYNSYCQLTGVEQRPICQCLQGYDFIDPDDIRKGCRPSFVLCDEASQETNLFEFVSMSNADWVDSSSYEIFEGQTEDWCRQACLSDCFCAVVTFKNGDCKKMRIPLSNGVVDPDVNGKALVKVWKGNSTSERTPRDKKYPSTSIRVGSVLFGSSVFLNLLLLLLTLMLLWRSKRKQVNIPPQKVMPEMYVQSFTYNELEEATNGFKEELGHGAFGTVYKGEFASKPELLVAVKKLDKMERNGEQEFQTEVTAIGRTNHKNLVQLLGFCNEGQNRLLVYEYMRNGSVAKFLFENLRPNWHERIKIAFEVAKGLCYLHEECSSCIIHCDIKPENILLDESFSARIADFGLAKLLKHDQNNTTTAIRGTKGYVAPEWFRNMPITVKVDVYSYGILLLEVISCRKKFQQDVKEEDEMILADWAYDCYKGETLHRLVEKNEEVMEDMEEVKKFVMIAIWCIQESPSLRPTMKKVIQMMEGAVEVPVPPNPASFPTSI